MQVICRGYKVCEYRESCEHAVPHQCNEMIWIEEKMYSENLLYDGTDCNCDIRYLRYDKLNKLKDVEER